MGALKYLDLRPGRLGSLTLGKVGPKNGLGPCLADEICKMMGLD